MPSSETSLSSVSAIYATETTFSPSLVLNTVTPDEDLPCNEIPETGHLIDCPVDVASMI